ncbi:MAG: hypothetical protein A3E87_09240 [Gammaproteobacteria bacterium RIFCSPHIGHO2_12_FULL_35_23]|nr:MAG: hypothetical protein A3E87_09240 [Gammaproteobacteria bacterium RIFCSPHIGHO2_12_FULL_35_23]
MRNYRYKNLAPLYLIIFFGFIGYSLMITIFTPMLMHAQNGFMAHESPMSQRVILLGFLLALYPLGQFLGAPILGTLSDSYGRKKVLIISLCCTTFFYLIIALALSLHCLFLLLLGSFFAGLSEANIVVAQSAITDVANHQDRNRLFGYIYLSASMAYIIGPLVGGKLADPALVFWFNDATPFWTVWLILLFSILWVACSFQETKKFFAKEKINYFTALISLRDVLIAQPIRRLYILNFLFYLAIFGFFRCYPMYLVDEFHMQVNQSSEFIAWVAVPIVIANMGLTSFFTERFSIKTVTVASAFLTGLLMIIVIIPPYVSALWVTLFLTSLALALCLPACATLLSFAVSKDHGKVMGNNQSLQVLAESLSGIIGGLLAVIAVKLSLIVLGLIAIIAALWLLATKEIKVANRSS